MRATVQNWGLAGRDADLRLGWPTEGRSWDEWAVVVIDAMGRLAADAAETMTCYVAQSRSGDFTLATDGLYFS